MKKSLSFAKLKNVSLRDCVFAPRLEQWKRVTIPAVIEKTKETGRTIEQLKQIETGPKPSI